MSSPRQRAFANPHKPGWQPALREKVFLPPRCGQIGRVIACGEVCALLGDVVRIRVQYCGRWVQREYLTADLRPIPAGRKHGSETANAATGSGPAAGESSDQSTASADRDNA